MWQILFPSPSCYSQACFQNSGVFLPACTALSSWSACRRVLAEVTDGLLTARSSGALPRLRLAFLGRVAFLCPPRLLNWASLSPSFLPRYLACFKHWHFSQAESQAGCSSGSAAVLGADLTTLPSCLILLCQGFSGLLPAWTFSSEIQNHVSGSLLDITALSLHCL